MKLKVSTTLQRELQSLERDKLKPSYTIENNNGILSASKDKRLVHSKYSIENEGKNALKDIDKNTRGVMFYGFGLGAIVAYFIKNIKNYFDSLDDIKIIVIVNDYYLFDYIISNTDITIFENENIFFVSEKDSSDFIFSVFKNYNIFNFKFITLQSLSMREKENASLLYKDILTLLQLNISDTFTRLNFENMWIRNILYNSLHIKNSADISVFHKALKNFNAILVSAGPTLENYIDIIKKERDNFILIALDTSYNVLSKNNITADFIITADAGFYNLLDFVYESSSFHYLVADLITNKKILDITNSRANILTFSSTKSLSIVEDIENKFDTKISELFLGNTVATAMIDFADFLGISNALLVGFDNSYPYYYRHVKHTLSYEYYINNTDKLHTIESYYLDTIKNTSNMSSYPPTSYVLNHQIEYLNSIKDKYKEMNIMRLKSDAIDIDNIVGGDIKDIILNGSREKALNILKNLYKKNDIDKKVLENYYSSTSTDLKEFVASLYKIYNELVQNKSDCSDIYKRFNILVDNVHIAKNILNTLTTIANFQMHDTKSRLIFTITEAIKTSNYFNTRINIILEKLKK